MRGEPSRRCGWATVPSPESSSRPESGTGSRRKFFALPLSTSTRPSECAPMPNSGLSDCLRRSPSMRMTRLPSAASASARFDATVVLPSPGTVLVMRTTFAPCFEVIRCSFRLRLRMASEKSEPVPACVSRSEGASRRVRFPRRTAGMDERQDRLMRRRCGASGTADPQEPDR